MANLVHRKVEQIYSHLQTRTRDLPTERMINVFLHEDGHERGPVFVPSPIVTSVRYTGEEQALAFNSR